MSNPSKRKGTAWETQVTESFRQDGWPHAERMPLHGTADRGDINLANGTTHECKNHKAIDLAAWVDELEAEMANAGTRIGAVVHRRTRRTNPDDAYVTTTFRIWKRLLKEAGR